MRKLAGQVVAITGGARGIGNATAEAFAAEGARVAIGDLDGDLARTVAREVGGHGYLLDVTEPDSFAAFLEGVERDIGPCDILVNNAGIMLIGPFTEHDRETIDLQVDVNVRGVLYGMQLAARRMVPRGRGHIVNIASVVGRTGLPGGVVYSATKHAVVGASEALRAELLGTGVDVSVVLPTAVDTELATGLALTRVGAVDVEDVAAAIVDVVRHRRDEVMVPRWLQTMQRSLAPLPWRARYRIVSLLGGDRGLHAADHGRRRHYEERVRRSLRERREQRRAG